MKRGSTHFLKIAVVFHWNPNTSCVYICVAYTS